MPGTLVKPTGGRATVAGFGVEDEPGGIEPILGLAITAGAALAGVVITRLNVRSVYT